MQRRHPPRQPFTQHLAILITGNDGNSVGGDGSGCRRQGVDEVTVYSEECGVQMLRMESTSGALTSIEAASFPNFFLTIALKQRTSDEHDTQATVQRPQLYIRTLNCHQC